MMRTKALLRELGIRPQKALGQNFLVDERILQRILAAAEVSSADAVLEIGAGLGTLTEALAERVQRLVAVEIDRCLVNFLRQRLAAFPNTRIVQGDILSLDICQLLQREPVEAIVPFKVVANIPYYITSAVLRHLLETPVRPQLIVLMVQREVAQRIVATQGQMSLLAVSVQFYGEPSITGRVPAQAFYPVPNVDSAIVRIVPHDRLPLSGDDVAVFFRVVRAGFGQRRKQLRNSLAHGLALPVNLIARTLAVAGIERQRRAQTLSVGEWVILYRALSSEMAPSAPDML